MSTPFEGKRVLLGVSGSIAAYKAADLASKLTQAGAIVDVLMTASAGQFVTPMTFRTLTHRAVLTDLFDIGSPEAVEHVALATTADVLVVAPATAHMIAKLALGLADDPISVIALATTAPLVAQAGAQVVVAGSAVFNHPDGVEAAIRILKERLASLGA